MAKFQRDGGWVEKAIGSLVALAVRCLGSTWRIRTEGENPLLLGDGPQLGALWHRDLIPAAFVFRDRGFLVPISQSRDGNIASGIVTRLGYASPARGSSSKGGSNALRALVSELRAGNTAAIVLEPSLRAEVAA